MQVNYVLLADAANQTADGKTNVLGIFTRIMAGSFPCQHPAFALVIGVEADPTERGTRVPLAIHIVDDDGGQVWKSQDLGVNVPDGEALTQHFSIIFNFQGMTFPKPGDHRFEVTCGKATKEVYVAVSGPLRA